MNTPGTEIEQWMIEGALADLQEPVPDVWVADFDVDRQVVFSKLGPYKKLFLRPEKFVKRFYHTLYPLLIEDWPINQQVQLFEGFCLLNVQLDIRFQATLAFAQSQMEIISEINEYIKDMYYPVIIDLIKTELLNMHDDAWVREGLGSSEKSITIAVNEMFAVDQIQSQAICRMKASFADFPDVQPGKERIYLSVLKQSYEVTEQKREELFRQELLEQQQQLEHKHKQLDYIEQNAELERVRQANSVEHQKRLLLDEQQQQQELLEIQAQLHKDKLEHERRLKEMQLDVELQQKKHQEEQTRLAEKQSQAKQLEHETLLQQWEVEAEIKQYEFKQARWLVAKANTREMELQQKQLEEQTKTDLQSETQDSKKENRGPAVE